jgi:hypothetical protein
MLTKEGWDKAIAFREKLDPTSSILLVSVRDEPIDVIAAGQLGNGLWLGRFDSSDELRARFTQMSRGFEAVELETSPGSAQKRRIQAAARIGRRSGGSSSISSCARWKHGTRRRSGGSRMPSISSTRSMRLRREEGSATAAAPTHCLHEKEPRASRRRRRSPPWRWCAGRAEEGKHRGIPGPSPRMSGGLLGERRYAAAAPRRNELP